MHYTEILKIEFQNQNNSSRFILYCDLANNGGEHHQASNLIKPCKLCVRHRQRGPLFHFRLVDRGYKLP